MNHRTVLWFQGFVTEAVSLNNVKLHLFLIQYEELRGLTLVKYIYIYISLNHLAATLATFGQKIQIVYIQKC